MASVLISNIREQLISFLLQEENEDTSSFLLRMAKQGLGLAVGGFKQKVQKLITNFEDIQAVLEDAEKKQVKEASVRRWLKKLKDVAYDVEDLLEEWETAKLKSQLESKQWVAENGPLLKKVRHSISSSSTQIFQQLHISKKIDDFNERLDVIAIEKDRYKFEVDQKGVDDQLERLTVSLVDEKEIYGRDEEKTTLVKLLLGENTSLEDVQSKSNLHVISIVGMGGMGKTTLAQLVFNHHQVQRHFEERIWVCVSDTFDEMRIAKAILESLKNEAPKLGELETLLKNINECVAKKKILLVLDDVWTDDRSKWEQLKDSLKSCSPGSRIFITTRKEVVAINIGTLPENIFSVQNLSEEECWLLFSRIAFQGRTKRDCEELEEIGRQIVKKCKGLPLAAKVLGGLMCLKRRKKQWQSILESGIWELEEVEKGLFPPLLLSYYDLPAGLKRCFSYCAVFPKDKYISRDELIKLWMAQGYLQGTDCKDMESLGNDYFDELIMRSLFQDFTKDVNSNVVINCKMHDIVHDCALLLTKTECFSVQIKGPNKVIGLFDKAHHLSLITGGGNVIIPESIHNGNMLRSLLFYGSSSWIENASLSKLFDQLSHLRTVNLSSCCFTELPESIGRLIHLKYLNLSNNSILTDLPDVLCDLCNLQTLDIRNCSALEELPSGLGNLCNLRHLRNKDTSMVRFMPKGMGKLTCLRTLDVFVVDSGTTSLIEVGDLIHLRHLLCLVLYFTTEARHNDTFLLESLQPPLNLEILKIDQFKGPMEFPNRIASLTKLKTIVLSNCANWDCLPPLGKLLTLEELSIEGMNNVKVVGVEFLGVHGGSISSLPVIAFPKLRVLQFFSMRNWEDWDYRNMSSSSSPSTNITIMPNLQFLGTFGCPKLKALPSHHLRNTTLKELCIFKCPILEECCRNSQVNDWFDNSHVPAIFLTDGRMLRNRVGDEISETNRFQGLGMPVIQKAGNPMRYADHRQPRNTGRRPVEEFDTLMNWTGDLGLRRDIDFAWYLVGMKEK